MYSQASGLTTLKQQKEISMLVLNRRRGESIIIGDNISITVLDTDGGNVKIGINAPREVKVDRAEIHERKARGPGYLGQNRLRKSPLS